MENAARIPLVEALKAENAMLLGRLAAAELEARQAREQLAQLAHELSQLKRLVFGVKSERFEPVGGPAQLPLFEGGIASGVAPPLLQKTAARNEAPRK